ncbi:MAG: geranylgeranylglycerol-phosphate geranylgeranyltransferase [Bacteroidota bacterium]
MNLLKLIRWPNLIIVGLTQSLLFYCLLVPAFQQTGLSTLLDFPHFLLLIFSTILIAAGGYIINDILDYPIDMINKPEKVIVEQKIPLKSAWNLYYGTIILGLVISLYLANHVNNLPLVLIFPTAVFLLWQYSKNWKKQVLIGNLTVALFCAMVAGIVWFAERHSFGQLWLQHPEVAYPYAQVFIAYLLFAFLSTLFREVVKDAEDVLGDELSSCRTLPVVYGIKKTKMVAGTFGIVLLLSLVYWAYQQFSSSHYWEVAYLVFAIIVPTKLALFLLDQAKSKANFHQLSQLAKYIMLSGLLYLIVYYFRT